MARKCREEYEEVAFSGHDIHRILKRLAKTLPDVNSRDWSKEDARTLQAMSVFTASQFVNGYPDNEDLGHTWMLAQVGYQVGYEAGKRHWVMENMRVAEDE